MIRGKIIASAVPFIMLANDTASTVSAGEVASLANSILKWGELGLCLVLVAYLIWSNYSLVNSLQKILKEKTAQEERLIGALHEFCSVCRDRPCLLKATLFDIQNLNGLTNQKGKAENDNGD